MYYATTITIDGIDIITGIDKKSIDRVETELKIKHLFEQLNEFKAIQGRNEKAKLYYANIQTAKKSQQQVIETAAIFKQIPISAVTDQDLTLQQREKMNTANERIKFNMAQIAELQKDLPAITEKLKSKKMELIKNNAVYFGMPENAVDLSEAQAENYIKLLTEIQTEQQKTGVKKVLTLTGEKLEDNRGKKVWQNIGGKWSSRIILSLKDTIDISEILDENLIKEEREIIAEQEEFERLSTLTETEKQAEIESLSKSLLSQSVNMKNELEIQGDPDALKKSQTWYQEELASLQKKYA